MFRFNPFKKRNKTSGKSLKPAHGACQCGDVENQLEIVIGGVLVKINRCSTAPPTNELSAIIPRAEIRRRCYSNGRLTAEEEIILNSITLVDAPRHQEEAAGNPPAGAAPELPEPP